MSTVKKRQNKEKEAVNGPFLKTKDFYSELYCFNF